MQMQRVGFIFPGQGSQTIGMGKSFVEGSEVAKKMLEDASARTGVDFEALLFEENKQIEQTEFTQPAILLVSMMAHKLFTDAVDVKPVFALGHSLGEFSAVAAAGALDPIDAVALVKQRGALMQQACSEIEASMMAVIGLDDDTVAKICEDAQAEGKKVWPANYNSEGQIVIAGLKEDLQYVEPILKEAKAKRALLLNMSVSSHCDLLAPSQAPLKEAMEAVINDTFTTPVISNVTAQPYQTKAEAIDLLTQQLVKPVLYKQSIAAIANDVDVLIEFGNGNVLKGLNRRIDKNLTTYNVSDMDSLQEVIKQFS
jgi:[acyl-carrier-protein] S-malonyltransferase